MPLIGLIKESIGEIFFRIALWIPLRENIVSSHIVYIFKTAGDSFWSNFETLIKVSTETFSHRYALNLKHLRLRKSRLLVTTLYLQISYHDLKLKLIPLKGIPLGIPFNNKVGQLFHELGHVTFCKHVFWSANCTLSFYVPNLLHPNFNFIAFSRLKFY